MNGAAQRVSNIRTLNWEQAMLQRMDKPPSLEQYTGVKPKPAPSGLLDMKLRSGVRGLKAISMKEYLSTKH